MEWPAGEGPPPRGPQHHMVRGNADDTEVVPPNELLPAKSDACTDVNSWLLLRLSRWRSNLEWPAGEGLPPRGPQYHTVRGNADDTEVVPPS